MAWIILLLTGLSHILIIEFNVSRLSLPVTIEVPQGSILGPLLFVLFVNDMPYCVKDPGLINRVEYNNHESEIVLYADDSTLSTSHTYPDTLQQNIQHDADLATQWIRDNELVCSGGKTKLLVNGTAVNRRFKLDRIDKVLSIQVCGKTVKESSNEKLIGVIINNKGTWRDHLHGFNNEEEGIKELGLIKNLSKRVGLLRNMRKYLSDNKFNMICNGLFYSKLIYCLSVWGGMWNLPNVLDDNRRCNPTITLEDNRKLQVLQNSVLRLKTGLCKETPVNTLLAEAKQLSVQQLTAYHSVLSVYKCKQSTQPEYIYNRLFPTNHNVGNRNLRTIDLQEIKIEFRLSLSRSSFFTGLQGCGMLYPYKLKLLTL